MTNIQPRPLAKLPHVSTIAQLFHTPERYYRSVNLERDFHDPRALTQYVLTPSLRAPFDRVLDGLAPGSGRRAWRLTGDYGSGKSSFALVLAHLLGNAEQDDLSAIRNALNLDPSSLPRLLPVLVTGHRAPLIAVVARAVQNALESAGATEKAVGRSAVEKLQQAGAALDGRRLTRGLELARDAVQEVGYSGIFLVLDELGKFLEEAAIHPDRDDVFVLQQLAEVAARSGSQPIVLLGLLHQGFHAYSDRLPPEARLEWDKIAGRFEELTFDQPLAHTMSLVQAALNVDTQQLPHQTSEVAQRLVHAAQQAGWPTGTFPAGSDIYLKQYPLHPTLAPVLVRFFARFGQNERSLYNFLLSHEPGTLQDFASRVAASDSWYTLVDFYDYVRAAYGHRLSGSYRTHWARMIDTIDAASSLPSRQVDILKTVAVLNVLEADHLSAAEAGITAALNTSGETTSTRDDIADLRRRGLLFERRRGADFRLWPTSSINLDDAYTAALAALGTPEPVRTSLPSFLETQPLLARRHAIETGTLRYFELRYVTPETLAEHAEISATADGALITVLCETAEDHIQALQQVQSLSLDERVLVCITAPLDTLDMELHEVRVWEWVVANTPELAHDPYARTEALRQLKHARGVLADSMSLQVPLRGLRAEAGVEWFHAGEVITLPERGVTAQLSKMCDAAFPLAPQVNHELLNRHTLSSAGAGARMRLIEMMVKRGHEAGLGFADDKMPPEKSMYLSVLVHGRVHQSANGEYALAVPDVSDDPLRLAPVLNAVLAQLRSSSDARVSVRTLLTVTQSPPFGTRSGLAMLLLVIVLTAHAHDIAVYEDGSFVPEVNGALLQRLTKAPDTFHLQWAAVTGVRAEVFDQVAAIFAQPRTGHERNLLDVVTPLCIFVAQTIPEYTRRTTALSPSAARVRNVLLKASEPSSMLFRELPEACGLTMFAADETPDPDRVKAFIQELQRVINELREAYPQLLAGIERTLEERLGLGHTFSREQLATRATAVALRSQDDLALRAFAHRLIDLNLNGDLWLEAIASTVVTKTPRRWIPGDDDRFQTELAKLARKFQQVAHIIDQADPGELSVAYHVGLTSIAGETREEIAHLRPSQEGRVREGLVTLKSALPRDRSERLIMVSQLLWELLRDAEEPL